MYNTTKTPKNQELTYNENAILFKKNGIFSLEKPLLFYR